MPCFMTIQVTRPMWRGLNCYWTRLTLKLALRVDLTLIVKLVPLFAKSGSGQRPLTH